MNRREIEALLYRVQDAFPTAPPPRPGTIDEWITSPMSSIPADVAFATFDEWRDTEQWPPTIGTFHERCLITKRRRADAEAAAAAQARREQQALLDAADEVPDRDEVKRLIAETRALLGSRAAPRREFCDSCGQELPESRRKLTAAELRDLGLKGAL